MPFRDKLLAIAETPSPTPSTSPPVEEEAKIAVTGTMASTLAPKIFLPPEKAFRDKLAPMPRPTVLLEADEAKGLSAAKTFRDKLLQGPTQSAYLKGDDPDFHNKEIPAKKSDLGFSGLGKAALTALSIEEYLEVKTVRKALGKPDLPDLSKNTWGNLLREQGLPNSVGTDALGFAMAVTLSPSTYLTFGTTGMAKIAGKFGSLTLTNKGMKLVEGVVKDRVEQKVATLAAKTGKEVPDAVRNRLVEDTTRQVNGEVIQKFRQVKGDVDQVKVGGDVGKLSDSIFDYGGINLSVPFSGAKYNLIEGKEVARIVHDVGLPKVTEAVSKASKAVGETEFGQAVKAHVTDPLGEQLKAAKRALGERFIPNYGKPKELLSLYEDTARLGDSKKVQALNIFKSFFSEFNGKQQKEFMEAAINASNVNRQIRVSDLAKDPAVKRKLDLFYGQAESPSIAEKTLVGQTLKASADVAQQTLPKLKGSESIAEALAKWSPLVEDQRLKNWIPGILADVKLQNVNMKGVLPGDRSFLKERIKDVGKDTAYYSSEYTRDPVQALSVRLSQISYAKLQDQMYEKAVKLRMGNLKSYQEWSKLDDVEKATYTPFRSPLGKHLVGEVNLADRAKEPLVFVKQDFAKAFEESITKENTKIPFLSGANSALKASLTMTFPAFFARNFRSNIIFNAHSIGLQTLSPKLNMHSIDMVRGKNLDKRFISNSGEALTLGGLVDEMKATNTLRGGDLFFDIAGEGIKDARAKNIWEWTLTRLNPFSPSFLPFAVGGRINNAIENQGRALNYLAWRLKGATPKMAAMEATEALLDYTKITNFEKKWANVVIPFYSFRRKNIEHHIKLIAHRPAFGAAYLKAFRDFGPTDEQWEGMPEWARNRAWTRWQGSVVGGWGIPLEDLFDTVPSEPRQLLSQLNPMIRYPAEKVTGIDFYTGRKLESVNAANEFKGVVKWLESPNVSPAVKGVLRNINEGLRLKRDPSKPDKIIGDPERLHLLRNMFTSRWQSTLGLLQNEDKTWLQRGLQFGLGIIVLTPDEEKQVSIERQKAQGKLRSNLVKKGVGFEVPHVIAKDKANATYINNMFKELKNSSNMKELRELEKEHELESLELEKEMLP